MLDRKVNGFGTKVCLMKDLRARYDAHWASWKFMKGNHFTICCLLRAKTLSVCPPGFKSRLTVILAPFLSSLFQHEIQMAFLAQPQGFNDVDGAADGHYF